MAELVVLATDDAVPQAGLANTPTIRVRRLDTNALVETDSVMTDVGDGLYSFDLTTVDGLEYGWRADMDPTASGQVSVGERYQFGVASGTTDARIETDIVAILADSGTTIPALIAALNDLSIADVQTALTNQGYTAARAPNLDNLDATVSSRNSVVPMTAALSQTEHDATQAFIAALNDPTAAAIADAVWTEVLAVHDAAGNAAEALEKIRKFTTNRAVVSADDLTVTIFEDDGSTPAFSFTMSADLRTRTPV